MLKKALPRWYIKIYNFSEKLILKLIKIFISSLSYIIRKISIHCIKSIFGFKEKIYFGNLFLGKMVRIEVKVLHNILSKQHKYLRFHEITWNERWTMPFFCSFVDISYLIRLVLSTSCCIVRCWEDFEKRFLFTGCQSNIIS